MNRLGVAGSAASALILAAFLVRTTPSAPAGAVVSQEHGRRATSSVRSSAKRGQAKPARARSKSKSDEYLEEGPWQASQEHFAGTWPKGCPPDASPENQKTVATLNGVNLLLQQTGRPQNINHPREEIWCIPHDQQVQAMIAIAPDPGHTNLSLVFDRSVEALQLAAQSTNYVADRYWLPWDVEPKANWADYASWQLAGTEQNEKEKQPGLLLFRWNGDPKQIQPIVLYVFLVGDASTTGINGEQFSRAVDYVQQVCATDGGSAGCSQSKTIFVMGPTFSGSLDSLRRMMEAQKRQIFKVYSGTVSSSSAVRLQHLPFEFHSSVEDTELALADFLKVLQDDGDIDCKGRPQVAILSEAATTYGGATVVLDDAGKESCYANFFYPREIASLRNAYQTAGAKNLAPAKSDTTSPYLSLNLADQTNRSDEPPEFASLQGPLSKEAVLMNYAADMRRNRYKYIGLNATNVLDALFLTNFLRTAVPDARVFILNADLLFERELDNTPYIGTLSITSYPLIAKGLEEANGDKLPHFPFADQYEQGQYYASLQAIGGSLGHTETNAREDPRGLWLTVVGAGGYWPVRALSGESPNAREAQLSVQAFAGSWQVLAVLLSALAFIHCGILIWVSPLSVRFRDFSLLNAEAGQRLFFIHVASASLALGLMMLAAPAFRSVERPGLATVLSWLLLALLIASAILQLNYLLRWKAERSCFASGQRAEDPFIAASRQTPPAAAWKVALQLLGSVAVWVIAGKLFFMWKGLLQSKDSGYGFYFGYRSLNLGSGVSPFAPMLPLLAAIYFWGISEVWRLRFNDRMRPRLKPVEDSTDQDFSKLRPAWRTESCVARAVTDYDLDPFYAACFMTVFLAWFSFFAPWHAFDLFERPAFGHLYEVLFCLVMAMILACGFRLLQIWTELRKLLLELKRSTIRFGFSRLRDYGWSPIWRQGSEEAEWSYMAQSFECLTEIANCEGEDGTLKSVNQEMQRKRLQIRNAVDGLRGSKLMPRTLESTLEYLGLVKGSFVAGYEHVETLVHGLQNDLSLTLGDLLDRVQSSRESCPGTGELEEQIPNESQVEVHCCEEKSDPKVEQRQRIERYVALRYVAFIRSVLTRIRSLLIFLAASFSLLMISLNAYSFEPHQALIWAVTAVFVVVGCISIVVLMQIHRDYILSRITGTKPNQLGLEFYLRIIALGVVPLLTLLSTHFPSIGHRLLSFLQPGLEALK